MRPRPVRRAIAAILATSAFIATAGCSSPSYLSSGSSSSAPSCSDLFSAAVAYQRTGSGNIDSVLQTLADRCSDTYEIATDYLSNASMDPKFRPETCDELAGYGVRDEAVALLAEDGLCSSAASAAQPPASRWQIDGAVGWDEAGAYAGSVRVVCGPLMSLRNTPDGAFLNLGRDYPSRDRFAIVFWDIHLESIPTGAEVCGTGEIYIYDGGVAQMEMWDPTELQYWL